MTKEEFTNFLDANNIERPKCRECGQDMFYSNIRVHINKNGRLEHVGTSFWTKRNILNRVYNLQICQECRDKFNEQNHTGHSYNVLSYTSKYAFDIDDETFIKARKTYYGSSLEHKIRKFGEEEGRKRWETYCKRQSETNTFEYKHKVYGMTEKEFRQYNKSRAATKANMIKRWGEELSIEKWNSYVEKQKLTKSWGYMVETYGIEKARQINRSKVNSLESYRNRYGIEEGTKKWDEYIQNYKSGFSLASQRIFRQLDKYLGKKYTTYFATKNFEFAIVGNEGDEHFSYKLDYYIKELNVCIEYNGGCFHGDSRIYEDNEKCNPWSNKTAKEIREQDEKRYRQLKNVRGIDTYVIWELDVNKNKFDAEDFIKNILKIEI